jgi:hypothetical protein
MSERIDNITQFPFSRTVDRIPNDARLELVFEWTKHLEPAAAKRLIMQMRSPEVAFLDQQQADIAMSALGLEAA